MVETGSIIDNIKRYQRLRMHSDKAFKKQLQQLTQWKTEQTLISYDALMDSKAHVSLLDYYFRDIFSGIDLSELKNADNVVKIIDSFFSGTQMLAIGMAFNAIVCEVNQRLTEVLFEDMKVDQLNEEHFLAACHKADIVADLNDQLDLFQAFATDINETVNDSLIVSSVKLATVPARLAGFKKMHKVIADGFKHARSVDNAQDLALDIIRHEREVVENIKKRKRPVFFAMVPEN